MRAFYPTCLILAALLAAACSNPSSEPQSDPTATVPADSLLMDSSATLATTPLDSAPASGKAGLSFGRNMPLGGQHKSKASALDALGGKPGTFQRRSPILGLPNRGMFRRPPGMGAKTEQAPAASPWDAYLACDAADAPVPVSIRLAEDAWEFERASGNFRLPFKNSARIFLTRCGADVQVHIWDDQGRPADPGQKAACPGLRTQSWNGPLLCVAQQEVALRFVCGDRLVVLAQGAFQEFDLRRCGVMIELPAGKLRLYSACAVDPVSCD